MADILTIAQLQNASRDAQTLEVVVNGDDNTDVTSRLGQTYPTLDKALKLIMQHGLVGSTPYRTYADLVKANIANNTYAVVTNDSDPAKNGLYLQDKGVLKYSDLNSVPYLKSEIMKLLSEQIAQTVTQVTNAGNAVVFAFADEKNKIGVNFDSEGNINANNISSADNNNVAWAVVDENNNTPLYIDMNGNVGIGNLQFIDSQIYAWAVADESGRVALAIDKNGNLVSNEFDEIKNISNAIQQSKIEYFNNQKTDFMHVFSYGQSLSRGTMCVNPINTTQPYKNVTFKTGVLDRDYEGADYTSFIPLIAWDNGKGEAESPICGMLNTFVEKQIARGDTAEQWKMVGSAPGEGGRSIAYLSKGGGRYADLLKQVTGAMTTANNLNQSYSVWAVTWTEAEQDYEESTPREIYKQHLIQLHDDLKTDIVAITKQTFTPPLICYQIASHRYYKKLRNDLALALLDASHERKDIVIACPMYQFNYYPWDSLHLVAETSVMLGRYYANALDYMIQTGKKWLPLEPKTTIVQGKIIDIDFTKSGLVLDTTLVNKAENYGFDIWQGDNLQNIIASVSIADKSRVRIVLSSDLPPNAYLSYARGRNGDPFKSGNTEGARGNLRDSAGDIDNYTDRVGKKYMHNWCVAFETKLN